MTVRATEPDNNAALTPKVMRDMLVKANAWLITTLVGALAVYVIADRHQIDKAIGEVHERVSVVDSRVERQEVTLDSLAMEMILFRRDRDEFWVYQAAVNSVVLKQLKVPRDLWPQPPIRFRDVTQPAHDLPRDR